jgi:glycerol uptake facilitator-like aquaporin
MILILVILQNKYAQISPTTDGVLGITCVMAVLFGLISTVGPFTGACFNPCIGLVLPICYAIIANPGATLYVRYIPSYVIGPILGGILAALFTKYIAFEIWEQEREKKKYDALTQAAIKTVSESL